MENDNIDPNEIPVEAEALDLMPDTAVAGLMILSERVERLALLCERLAQENRILRDQQAALEAERDGLREKNEQSRLRIDAMIVRLKGLGQG
ncbi:MAG: TIGR02449 family protein [Synechococcaceae cyanobacterium SM1_2_3]|nr:TIGR02449 family protein [Synechococcaceae cyanobacterium SM1_2_3]